MEKNKKQMGVKVTDEQLGKPKEFEERVIEVNRISRTVAGGRRLRFRALVAVGNQNNKVGIGIAKAGDVATAVAKAIKLARKNLFTLQLIDGMIDQTFVVKYGATQIIMKPGRPGGTIVAGGSLRDILEVAGIKSVVAKIIGSTNKINVARATMEILKRLSC